MTPGALTIVMVTFWVRRGSSGALGAKPAILSGRRAMEYCLFVLFSARGQVFTRKSKKKVKLTEQAIRGNVNDCFDPFGTKISPRRVRTPESPTVATPASASASNPLGVVPLSCGQNTPFATFETNVLLLRRAPCSSAASEPSAMVRRRHTLGTLE